MNSFSLRSGFFVLFWSCSSCCTGRGGFHFQDYSEHNTPFRWQRRLRFLLMLHIYIWWLDRDSIISWQCVALDELLNGRARNFFDWNSLDFLMRRIITQRAESQPTTTQSVSGSGIEFGSRFHLGSRRDDYYFPFVTDGQLCCSIRQGRSLLLQVLTCSDDLSKFQWPTYFFC